ncbi:PIF-like transposase [Arachis hypogaea]|nr:PIF-like transposase [Arachis hypogaea]
MLAMFLFVLGGGNSNKSTKERFQHSGETISQKFEEVLQAVCKMAIDIIQPKDRDFKEVPTKLRNDDRYWPHFKDAIGAIDGTHVPVIVSTEDQIRFIGRKGIPTQNVMAACNFDMEFTFALAGKYYLVDAGYPEKKGYLGPYKGATYHLPEFRRVNGPSGYYEIYNYAHSSLRSVIERTFGMDVELEEEDGYGDEGEAENGVEKVGDEFLGTMEMVRNNIASSLIGGKK